MNSRTTTSVILTIKHRKHHCGPGWCLDSPAVVRRCHIRLKDKGLPTGNDPLRLIRMKHAQQHITDQKINRQYCIWVVIEGVGFALVERSRSTEEKLVRKSGVAARTAGRCCHRYHASCVHGSNPVASDITSTNCFPCGTGN